MSPKSLLRHALCKSHFSEFEEHGEDTRFQRVIPEAFDDDLLPKNKIRKVIYCSGQVYYHLLEERKARNIKDIAILRLEQIAPFPWDSVVKYTSAYPASAEIVWCQEEPMNMGAWYFASRHFKTALKKDLTYVGRPVCGSTATGKASAHKVEKEKFINAALK